MDTDHTDGEPVITTDLAPDAPVDDEAPPRPAKTAIDWARSNITPGLVRALVAAQKAVRTVAKGGTNEGGERRKAYNYATADAMIGEARQAFGAGELAWVCASRAVEPPTFDLGENQWACSLVITESVLLHAGEDAEHNGVGMLVLTGECISIGSTARPPDKADKAAETYLRGFIARDLLAIDRGGTPKDEDVDQRPDDSNTASRGRTSTRTATAADNAAETEIRDQVAKHCKAITEVAVAEGNPRPSTANIIAEIMGAGWKATTAAEWAELRDKLAERVHGLHKTSGQRKVAKA